MRKAIKARKYTSFEEMHRVYKLHLETQDSEINKRTSMVMLSWDGYSIPEIGQMTDTNPNMVFQYIKNYNTNGIEGLHEHMNPHTSLKLYGKKEEKEYDIEDEIVKIFYTPSGKLGLPFDTWTMGKIAGYMVQNGMTNKSSSERVRQILHKKRVNIRKAKLRMVSSK